MGMEAGEGRAWSDKGAWTFHRVADQSITADTLNRE